MKKGFTLLELLIVVGIMSLLGTISVNGYRAVTRGMEERSAISSASAFLRAARQRAEIDNKPIFIFYWNEMLQAETDEEPAVIVGKAIAVQQTGRISGIGRGGLLIDEFADLNMGYDYVFEDETPNPNTTMRLYNVSSPDNCTYALVSTQVQRILCEKLDSGFLKSESEDRDLTGVEEDNKKGIRAFGFKKVGGRANFEAGDAYGFEFANLTLAKGYLFGSQVPSSMSAPVSGENNVPYRKGNGFNIEIYSLRPEKGQITAKSVGTAKDTY